MSNFKLEDFIDEKSRKRISNGRPDNIAESLWYNFDYFPLGYGVRAVALAHIMKAGLPVSKGIESPSDFSQRFGLYFDKIGLSFDYGRVRKDGLYLPPCYEGNNHLLDHDDLNMTDSIDPELSRWIDDCYSDYFREVKVQKIDFFRIPKNLRDLAKISHILIGGVNHCWDRTKPLAQNESERILISDGDKIMRYYEAICQDAVQATRNNTKNR